MNLRFNVECQHITRTDRNIVVAKSQNYLKARFDFSPDWAGKTKTAVFNNNGHIYNVILDNDECYVAEEVIRQPGFTVSVFGGDLITADVVMIRVEASGYEIGGSPESPTPEVYEQVLGMFDKFRGGDEGQVLSKSSDNDLDFEWVPQTGGGGGTEVIANPSGPATASLNKIKINGVIYDGLKGDPGDDYVLTAQDKADIADLVIAELPTAESIEV